MRVSAASPAVHVLSDDDEPQLKNDPTANTPGGKRQRSQPVATPTKKRKTAEKEVDTGPFASLGRESALV